MFSVCKISEVMTGYAAPPPDFRGPEVSVVGVASIVEVAVVLVVTDGLRY